MVFFLVFSAVSLVTVWALCRAATLGDAIGSRLTAERARSDEDVGSSDRVTCRMSGHV